VTSVDRGMAAHPRIAVYPGTFDPLTNGHVDIIERGLGLFDRIIVAILENSGKQPLFTVAERVAIIREVFAATPIVEVETFGGLLVDYVRSRRAHVIVRGLRTVSDFDYERQMALMNRHLSSDIETVFMMPSEQYAYVSSTLIKDIAALGGSLAGLVPPVVDARLARRREAATTRRA
jgi:pantetheine-phosphate adenylyltransferase